MLSKVNIINNRGCRNYEVLHMKDWLSFTQQNIIGQTLPWITTKCRGMVVGNVSHTPELRFYWSLSSIISRAWFTHFPSPALLCV